MQGSPLPVLPIRPLTQAGVFEPPAVEGGAESWVIVAPGLRGVVRYVAAEEHVSCGFSQAGREQAFLLPIVSVRVGLGTRRYWECQRCGAHTAFLILAGGAFVCRSCYRQGRLYPPAHANALLVEAEQAISGAGCSVFRFDALAAEAVPKPASRRREARDTVADVPDSVSAQRSIHSLSTEAAIRRGQGLVDWDMYDFYSRLTEAEVDELPTAAGFERPATVAIIGNVPELDLNVVLRELRPQPGSVVGQLMQWSEVRFGRFRLLFVDDRFEDLRIVLASNIGVDDEHVWQRLPAHRQADGRVRFVCPVTHTRCDILYERDGLFASRQAQRVVHASQRGVKRKAAKPHD